MSETRLVQCGYEREGPKVARHVVAWRERCRRKVRAPADQAYVRCWQHATGSGSCDGK